MLSVCHFNKCMNTLLTFAGVPVDENKNTAWYNLMKNDFSNTEFSRICSDICKTATLYGRYPDPKLFYERYEACKDKVIIQRTDAKLLEAERKDYKQQQKERAEKTQRWLDFIKQKGYDSTASLVLSGKGNFTKLRNEFNGGKYENK